MPTPEWLQTAPLAVDGVEVAVNKYFLNHPEMVLGTWSRKDTLYGAEGYSVTSNGELAEQLRQAVQRLPEYAPAPAASIEDDADALSRRPVLRSFSGSLGDGGFTPPPPDKHIGEGSFFVRPDRTICQSQSGLSLPVNYGGKTLKADGTLTGRRLAALIGLRDLARRVLQSQNEGWPQAHRDEARRELNRAYDRFAAAYGPINKTTFSETADGNVIRRMPNIVKFKEDPDAMLVMSLEDYDEVTGKAAKSAIMLKDVVGKNPPITAVASAEEGLLVSLNQRGAVDLPFIGELYGKPARRSSPSWATSSSPTRKPGSGRRPTPTCRATSAPSSLPPRRPARRMPATSRHSRRCSRKTCCPATSTPIWARRGFPPPTSRLSPPICSMSSRRPSRSPT